MAVLFRRNRAFAAFAVGTLALAITACSSKDDGGTSATGDCSAYQAYDGHDGTTVTASGSIRDTEADDLETAWKKFSECTGIIIEYTGDAAFEAQLQVRVDGGNPPDLAFIPQPGLLARLATNGKVKEASAEVKANAEKGWSKDWQAYGTVNGKLYAAPLGANVKSFVWYSPKTFKDKGYAIPKTWDELITLSDKMAGDGLKPWCAGFSSGDASGWPGTDWMEDILLRTAGPEVYDRWVAHKIAFNDPLVADAMNKVGTILKNPKYVNAGFGEVKSIASTDFKDGGLPILKNQCGMHRQASFYAANWPSGTKVAEDGDVFAFYFPAVDPAKRPVLGAGEFVAAFTDRPEVKAFQTYLASAEYANSRAKVGHGWVSANKALDVSNIDQPIAKLSAQILQDPNAVFRFDGSDQMPSAVGAGTFWKQIINWISGQDTATTLTNIENSWPK